MQGTMQAALQGPPRISTNLQVTRFDMGVWHPFSLTHAFFTFTHSFILIINLTLTLIGPLHPTNTLINKTHTHTHKHTQCTKPPSTNPTQRSNRWNPPH
ncbi:hypothetical protein GGI42DRAFT_324861 [Trichoderma sp. SZMC 28013]